ncbi:flagellar assembly protein FliX [Methylobacterium oryzae]|uniref:flagellar assembly protein FliX n=1 Tax=Methylobacterium oryzae TaxID=334852 RepID=UPI002F3528A8
MSRPPGSPRAAQPSASARPRRRRLRPARRQERRRRSAQRGQDLLDGLDRLKAALLGGRVAPQDLRAIAGRLNERAGLSGDPRLDGLMAEIELRAAVELAKLEMARGV